MEHVWIKYCGISDECAALENRWKYLSRTYKWLPDLSLPFRRVQKVASWINREMLELGFTRRMQEKPSDIMRVLRRRGRTNSTIRAVEIGSSFLQLIRYLGYLKIAYFQRTSSSEIPHLESGVAHSLERTLGAEMIYRAVDRLAGNYVKGCPKGDWEWDGMVSFVYPIQVEQDYLAAVYTSGVLGLYNMSLSEEQKYFPFCGLLLCHEIGHVLLKAFEEGEVRFKPWVEQLEIPFLFFANLKMEEVAGTIYDTASETGWSTASVIKSHMRKCPLFRDYLHRLCFDEDYVKKIFKECLADLIAVKIGGVHTITALADAFSGFESLFRTQFLAAYYRETELENHLVGLTRKLQRQVAIYSEDCDWECIANFVSLAKCGGSIVRELDAKLIQEYLKRGNRLPEALRQLGLQTGEPQNTGRTNLFEYVVPQPFQHSRSRIEEAKTALKTRKLATELEPRILMHAYYDYFCEGVTAPGFAILIHSLAYNTWSAGQTHLG